MSKATINYALEQSIAGYLQAQVNTSGSIIANAIPSGSSLTIYTALNNSDKASLPGLVINCYSAQENTFNSRNYECDVRVELYEIAADTTVLGTLAGAIFNEFENSVSASANISNPSVYHCNFWYCQTFPMTHYIEEDAFVSSFELHIVGAMTP